MAMKAPQDSRNTVRQSALAPRRVGHINLYVRDWLNSLKFYSTVCGLEEVFRETPIKAGFLSSGNTHHDIGFLEARQGPRIGRDGFVQTRDGIGARPEFNHFGIEMENEQELVDGYRRLQHLGIAIEKLTDSAGLSKSVYLRDPDGVLLQFYADMTADWRGYYAEGERLVTGKWDPDDGRPPTRASLYTRNPIRYDAPRRAFRPVRVTGGTLYVRDLKQSLEFYQDIAGFYPIYTSSDRKVVALSARELNRDITLIQASGSHVPGLRHFSFMAGTLDELLDGYRRLSDFGLESEQCLDHGLCRSIYVRDPDGFLIEFYSDRPSDWARYLRTGGAWRYPEGQAWQPKVARAD